MKANAMSFRLAAPSGLNRLLDELHYDRQGLVTVVAQDARSGAVLMLAHANRQAMQKTLQTGLMHYYSRSRKKLWKKGEDSGHVQRLVSLHVDCDGDALLAKVRQVKAACHLGFRSCFSFKVQGNGEVRQTGKRIFDPATVYGRTKTKKSKRR